MISRRISRALAACLLALLGAGAAAEEPPPALAIDPRLAAQITPGRGLTADEAARRATETSLEVAAQRLEIEAAAQALRRARGGYQPRLSATARRSQLSPSEGNLGTLVTAPGIEPGPVPSGAVLVNTPVEIELPRAETHLQATLAIPLGDYLLRVPRAVHAAILGRRAAEAGLAAETARAGADARVLFYGWVRARLHVTVAEQALEVAREHLSDARKIFGAGDLSRANVMSADAAVADAELAVVRARDRAELLEAELRVAMHDGDGPPYAIGEDVLAVPGDEGPGLAELTARATARRPELQALDASAAATRARAGVERASALPRLDLVANATVASPGARVFPPEPGFRGSWDVSAQLSFTLNDLHDRGAAAAETDARAAQLEARRRAAADGVRLEVLAAWQAVREARVAIASTTRALASVAEAHRARRALFRTGQATSLELTDAELDLTRARLGAVDARIDLHVARARLARAAHGD